MYNVLYKQLLSSFAFHDLSILLEQLVPIESQLLLVFDSLSHLLFHMEVYQDVLPILSLNVVRLEQLLQ